MGSATSTTAYAAATEGQLGLVDGPIVRTFSQVGRTTTPGAGEIGEYVDAQCTALAETATIDTYVDVTGMEIELTPGRWLVGFDLVAQFSWVSGSIGIGAEVSISTAAGAVIEKSKAFFSKDGLFSASDAVTTNLSRSVCITVSSTTTYKVRVRANQNATSAKIRLFPSSITGGLAGNDNSSNIWAARIA